MEFDPKTPPVLTSERHTFAYTSALERWPVILTGAIDDLHRSLIQIPDGEDDKQKEGKEIVSQLAALKYELLHNRKLTYGSYSTPLQDDGEDDIKTYNKELEQRGDLSWFDSPWLYAECYLYRRINTLFTRSTHWKSYDIFARQKMSTFRSSRPAVLELGARYGDLDKEIKANHSDTQSEKADELLFTEMCEICLWGNATDLSLLTSLTYEDIQKLQGAKARKAAEENILVNDLSAAFAVLNNARKTRKNEERRVDIVLDNAGFELFVDLILAGYLLLSDLATTVILHPKSMPWFVSDVLPKDFGDLVSALADPQSFFTATADKHDPKSNTQTSQPLSEQEVAELQFLSEQWSQFHADGKLIIRPNRFWTTAGSYWRIPGEAPTLWDDLKESELVLFKGDLNYRKLTADAHWDPATPFSDAIGPLGPGSQIRTLALRTCKADVIVGLPQGEDERIRQTEGGGGESGARKWAWSGKWAVVQFCDGKA
ncbi:Hairy/enhancer-of-split with YRPW motif protein 2 [Ophidiomyces ophidiicola]|nr:Hairy/enhancer-of-split with YRPW motif protein 2 [Ophidiomyces ophidiicola]